MSWLFAFGGQSPGASAPVLPMSIQGWFPLGLPSLISLQSKRVSRVFSSTIIGKHQFFGAQPSLWSNSHLYMTTGKTIALIIQTFVSKVISLLFNTLSRFVIAFLPRSSCLYFMAAVTIQSDFRPQEEEICYCFLLFHFYLPWVMGLDAIILVFFFNTEF